MHEQRSTEIITKCHVSLLIIQINKRNLARKVLYTVVQKLKQHGITSNLYIFEIYNYHISSYQSINTPKNCLKR